MLQLLKFIKKPSKSGVSSPFFGVTFDSGGVTVILFKDSYPLCYAKERLTKGVVIDGRIVDKESFIQVLNVCVERCLEEHPGETVNEVYFGVGGGNCFYLLTEARQRRNPDEKISKNSLTGVYKEIEQNAMDTVTEEVYQTTGNNNMQLESVVNETTSIRLDGSIVYNPIGKSCGMLETEVFNAYCNPTFIDLLEDVSSQVKLKLGGVFPVQYLITKKLNDKQGPGYNATLINVHPDYTDVSVVFGGKLVKNKTLPLGGYDLEKDLDFWMDGLELAFLSFSGVKTFSNNVYLSGVGLERTDFWEMIEWRKWEEKIPFKVKPVFTKIDASAVELPQEYKSDLLICGLLSICKELA